MIKSLTFIITVLLFPTLPEKLLWKGSSLHWSLVNSRQKNSVLREKKEQKRIWFAHSHHILVVVYCYSFFSFSHSPQLSLLALLSKFIQIPVSPHFLYHHPGPSHWHLSPGDCKSSPNLPSSTTSKPINSQHSHVTTSLSESHVFCCCLKVFQWLKLKKKKTKLQVKKPSHTK